MNKDLPFSIHNVVFENPIWGILFNKEEHSLLIDTRNDSDKIIYVWKVVLDSLNQHLIDIQIDWWEKLIGVNENTIFSIKYNDQQDPSNIEFRSIDLKNKTIELLDAQPKLESHVVEPMLYEPNSDHHKTISQFLSLKLTFPCEYLEINDNIIISYYLRSEKGFDRFLLLIKAGNKRWKVKQDSAMKGFASGSFFVADDTLIFVKNRNEVCICTL